MGRNKPGKPRRERPGGSEHDHGGFETPGDARSDPMGPVDHDLLGKVVGAAFDGCTSCQGPLLTLLVEDANTTARLVGMACIAMDSLLGGLPGSLLDQDAPGLAALEFRTLASAGVTGGPEAMWQACADMAPEGRRAAVNSALDLLIGHLSVGL